MKLARGAAALCVLFSCACSEDLPPLVAESAHFRVHAWREIDPAFLEMLEQHQEVIGGWLNAPPAQITVYVHENFVDAGPPCQTTEVAGCAYDTVVHMVGYVPHELVHAYASAIGNPPRLINEGLAEVLGSGAIDDDTPVIADPERVRMLLDSEVVWSLPPMERHEAYRQFTSFVRFLIDRYGREAFLALYMSLPEIISVEGANDAFVAALGESFDDARTAWAAEPPRRRSALCLRLAECAAPVLADAQLFDSPTLFPSLQGMVMGRFPAADGLLVRAESDGMIEFGTCDASHQGRVILARGSELWLRLPPTEGWAYVAGTPDTAVHVEAMPSPTGDWCADSVVRTLPSAANQVQVHDALGGVDDNGDGFPDVVMQFTVDTARELEVRPLANWEPHDVASVAVCEGCVRDRTCVTGEPGTLAPIALSPMGTYTLVISGTVSGAGLRTGLWLQ